MFSSISTLYVLGVVIAVTVSGWIVTLRAQRRMKKSLGRRASLKTWMKVEEAEQREKESGPVHPR